MIGRLWVIVLAGGEGSRLRGLARDDDGEPAPKQYCRFGGERTMLAETLARAERLVPCHRIVLSVLEPHRRWWARDLADRPALSLVSQPCSRGTAAGLLGPLLRIQRDDPGAHVVIMPSDHAVDDPALLGRFLERAVRVAERRPEDLVLLGFTPDSPDPALGWIMPSRDDDGESHGVVAFVEKPDPRRATRLMADDGLWNGLLMAAAVGGLLRLFERFLPDLTPVVSDFLRPRRSGTSYVELSVRDIARDLLIPSVANLRVVRVPDCGWTDVGTPERLLRWQMSRGGLWSAAASRSA